MGGSSSIVQDGIESMLIQEPNIIIQPTPSHLKKITSELTNIETLIHYVENSHFDRSWYQTPEETAFLSARFFDKVIDKMNTDESYCFHADGIVAPVVDYLKARPKNSDVITKFIKEGRITMGPFYCATETSTITGATLFEILEKGFEVGSKLGGVSDVAYMSFSWIHNSQLPQILKMFGIEQTVFYRAFPSEDRSFLWEGADNTKIYSTRLSKDGRTNGYYGGTMPVIYAGLKSGKEKRIYIPGTEGEKMCIPLDKSQTMGWLTRPMIDPDFNLVGPCLRKLIEDELGILTEHTGTNHIIYSNGNDQFPPQDIWPSILKKMEENLKDNEKIITSTLPFFVKTAYESDTSVPGALKIIRGEMFKWNLKNEDFPAADIGSDVYSWRHQIKTHFRKAENLINQAERYYTLSSSLSSKDIDLDLGASLKEAWRHLIDVANHDDLAGCVPDFNARYIISKLDDAIRCAQLVFDHSIQSIVTKIDYSDLDKDGLGLVFFNSSHYDRAEVLKRDIIVPDGLDKNNFEVKDTKGNIVDFVLKETGKYGGMIKDNTNNAGSISGKIYEITIDAKKIPSGGYASFYITNTRTKNTKKPKKSILQLDNEGRYFLENEYLKVTFDKYNKLQSIHNKETGYTCKGIYFKSVSELGHPWTSSPEKGDKPITSLDSIVSSHKVLEDNHLCGILKIKEEMQVPADTIYGGEQALKNKSMSKAVRSDEFNPLRIEQTYTLKEGSHSLELDLTVENGSKGHVVSLVCPTGLEDGTIFRDTPFDIMENEIPSGNSVDPRDRHPALSFMGVDKKGAEDNYEGMALINNGTRHYYVNNKGDLEVILLRAAPTRLCTTFEMVPFSNDQGEPDGSQCIGKNNYKVLFHPVSKKDRTDVYNAAENLNHPISGYEVDRGDGELPLTYSGYRTDNPNVRLARLTPSRYHSGAVTAVFYNLSNEKQEFNLSIGPESGTFTQAHIVDGLEREIEGAQNLTDCKASTIGLQLGPKKITKILMGIDPVPRDDSYNYDSFNLKPILRQ